jgi:hypothetical protein
MMWPRCRIILVFLVLFIIAGCASHNEVRTSGGKSVSPVPASSEYSDVRFDFNHVNNCVYEVIVPKPVNDPINYEKPLPLDLLPFQARNDKYYPVGTAFACSGTEFASAAHVMNFWFKSHFKDVLIRDIKGNVFSIDKIVKFSSRRDFVVFTVKGRQSPEYLEINHAPEIGERVFAVGNALGQGVVIRDGLYTSNTPEEIGGKWNWIRFSAAASPGNSGGPLLDKNGKVVGVVLSKSPNENLNYALPISEVSRDYGNNAEIFFKSMRHLEIFDFVKTKEIDTTVKLPLTYDELKKVCTTALHDLQSKIRTELLVENKANTFPNGSGSDKLMYTTSSYPFPQLITRHEGGNWENGQPKEIRNVDLGGNGKIAYGHIQFTAFAKLDSPDNICLNDICSDSKGFMDLMLKALNTTRSVGPEKIRITSLGKSDSEFIHTDAYGRKWLVRTWPIEYADQEYVAFILPLPDGCAVMMKTGQTGLILDDQIEELKVLTDFFNVSYSGTFKQWREYLQLKNLIPSVFANMEIKPNNGSFSFESKMFHADCGSNIMKTTDESILTIWLNYFRSKGSVVWDVRTVMIKESKFDKNEFRIIRHVKPNSDDKKNSDEWLRLVDGRKPYDGQILLKDDATSISTVYKRSGSAGANSDHAILYSVRHTKIGTINQQEMESDLAGFMKGVVVHEN